MPTLESILTGGVPLEQQTLLLLGAGCGLLLTWPAIWLARHLGITSSAPGNNPFHVKGEKYKSGGLVIALVALTLVSLVIGFKSPWRTGLMFAGGLTLIGLLDDLHPLTPGWKIILQTPLALQVALSLPLPLWIEPGLGRVIFEVVWIIILTNAFNILDVADGLLPGIATILLWTLGTLLCLQGEQWGLGIFGVAYAAATLGILPRNAHRGVLILGDTGSLTLGGLGALMVLYVDWWSLGIISRTAIVFLLLPPVFEVLWVTVKRLRRGIAPWRGSPHHFVYWLTDKGIERRWAVFLMVLVEAIPATILLALLAPVWTLSVPILVMLVLLARGFWTQHHQPQSI